MALNRENIYAALADTLTALVPTTLKTVARRLEFAEEVDPVRLPGVWQLQVDEIPARYADTGVACWHFDVDWYVYQINNDESTPNTPLLNPLIDAVMALLPHDDNGNVAGLLKVDGLDISIMLRDRISYWEGLLNNRMVAVIPLRLLIPTGV